MTARGMVGERPTPQQLRYLDALLNEGRVDPWCTGPVSEMSRREVSAMIDRLLNAQPSATGAA